MKTVLFAIAASTFMMSTASADTVCMDATELQSSLIDWYGERPVADRANGNTRLWVSDATGSWTLVRTTSQGKACVEAQGNDWSSDVNAQQMLDTINANLEG